MEFFAHTKASIVISRLILFFFQGVQQPLRERYPVEDTPETRGIDSWLSVWSDGVLLEYIEGELKFFKDKI